MIKTGAKIVIFLILIYSFSFYNFDDKSSSKTLISNEQSLNLNVVDSLAKIMLYCDDINELTDFINLHPENKFKDNLKRHRRKLFSRVENVLFAKLNIDSILNINPCYTPLYKNIDRTKVSKKYKFSDLINENLPIENPYRNRYLLADLNTVNSNNESLGVNEIFPKPESSIEFKFLHKFFNDKGFNLDDIINNPSSNIDSILGNNINLRRSYTLYENFLNNVQKYKTTPIRKKRSIHAGKQYVTGQKICMCELEGDSINFIGQFVTSGRGKTRSQIPDTVETNPKKYNYYEALPIGKDANYYAPLYRITSKNWETQRKYGKIDRLRDSMLGGGNRRITFFDGKVQLPNFLLMLPDPLYKRAMRQNGIHESSISVVSKCMLGTPQSLGCLRMSDYTSKFLRWWTPQNAKLFVFIDENRYSNKIINDIYDEIPFRTVKEGNIFRRWVNKNHTSFANKLGLDEKGVCNNCYIYQAWYELKDDFLSSKEGRVFTNRIDSLILSPENHL